MDKNHKLVIAACIAAALLLLGVGAGVYEHYKHNQQAKATHSAQVASAQAKSQVQAQSTLKNQVQAETAKVNKMYSVCLAEAKKAKDGTSVCAE